ncbi:UNVERIFIED_CONTAM: hypothetical protein Slati_1329700 [Sesamum latifolium]|uniref:Chlorophyll a-b binding protein, chloroplastic n=1 Tax=Sesamum latifolium TaxID=2727402 RepID=A0AAW2XIB8_9LAMI
MSSKESVKVIGESSWVRGDDPFEVTSGAWAPLLPPGYPRGGVCESPIASSFGG